MGSYQINFISLSNLQSFSSFIWMTLQPFLLQNLLINPPNIQQRQQQSSFHQHFYPIARPINIIFISMLRKKRGPLAHFLLFSLLISLCLCFSYTNFQLTDSNQGTNSHYVFSFTPALSQSYVELVVTFPLEYSVSAFAGRLECFASDTGIHADYDRRDCWVEPDSTANTLYLLGSVVIDLNFVNSTRVNYVLLKNVKNPTSNLSSYFQVCLRKNGVRLECQKYFGKAVFTPPAVISPLGVSITAYPNPAYIGRGTTYTYSLKVSTPTLNYVNQNLIIRVKLDSDFSSDGPLCSIGDYNSLGYRNQYMPVNSQILPATYNEVDCGSISNLQSLLGPNNELLLKIDNMLNPMSFQAYSNAQIQIIRQLHMQPIETITFPTSPIQISPQNIDVTIKQSNYMRMSTNTYYFMLNHYTTLNESSSITIEFLSGIWKIYQGFAMFGFTSPSTLQYEIIGNKIKFFHYGNASHQIQQILGVNLTSHDFAGSYPVKVTTQLFNQTLGQWYGNALLNETIGTFNLLSVSAVQAATKLPVDSTGPLQMTFFLNYELPPSDDVPNGTLEITIFPQIPEPDPEKNGVVKCYWKGTLQAADCTYDNSFPNKTIITLVSPPHDAFKYSQIPVIITTEGGQTPDDLGLTIDPLVQRYRFQCEFHLYNSSTIPSQVFYTTWIADAIQLTTTTVMATTHECNEYTHLQINMTTPLLDSSLQKQFRIMVQFLNADGSGWAHSLGYQIDRIYQRYPCVVVGLVGTNIHCDLYTYYQRETPYSNMHINRDFSGPYILVYGFNQNVPTGIPVRIEIPKIKVGSTPLSKAWLGVSILEETPGQKEPYVELYYQDLVAFTTKNPISIPDTNVPSSQPTPIQIQTWNQYHIQWSPILPATVKYIMYELTPQYLPSLADRDAACTTNQCVGLGLPANWIVETPAATGAPHTMDTLVNYVRAMDYLPSTESYLPIRMVTYDGTGKTVDKYSMNIHYIAKPIPSCSFDFLQTTSYSGLEQWYSISFANTNSVLSSYPFLRFILANGLSFTDPPQCNSSTVMPFNESGLICVREDAQTMRVHNIRSLAPLGTYNMWFRMETTLPTHTAPISPIVDIHINHNHSVDSSIVSLKEDLMLTQAPILPLLAAPQKFEIHNPQILNEDIEIGYIGPVYIQFSSQVSGVFDINVQFTNHLYNGGFWRTPNTNNLDPIVCWLNQVRYDCSPTNQANKILKINTLQASVATGINQLRFDSEYIDPFNGIKYPDVPGMYNIKLSLVNATSTASVTLYADIQPPKFLHMQAGSIVKDVDTETVYKINFTLPVNHIYPNSYFDTANRSRIVVQFPTLIEDQPVFTANLGLYQGKFQERVGCYFKTGGTNATFTPTYTLQCRLIPSGKPGDPVKVEIINHAAFSAAQNSLSVYIFKVVNPVLSHSSVPITVKIDHIEVATGNIFPLYKQTYRIFLDPRPKNGAPVTYPSVDDPSVQFFETTKDVGDYGSIFMNAHTVSGAPVTAPFYMLVKLPPYLDPEDNQIAPAFSVCPASAFEQCVSVPEINYLMVKVILNTSQFQAVMKDYPISISLVNSYFYSNIIENGRFTGIIEYIISGTYRWQEIQGTLVLNYCQASGLPNKIVKNKDHFELAISFTTTNFIPEQGTIEIGFPSSVTNVKPHCRSSMQLGSGLAARSGASGQIGCMVQNTNKWVITGFADVPAGTTIIIRGQVDLPSTSGTIGMGHITTYADTNLIDIHSNGSRIDHLETDFNMILIDSFAMNANQDVFMSQRSVIRAGDVAEFRILLSSALPIANTDSVTLRMAMNDIRGTTGGFSQSSRPKVCQFVRIDTNQQIGCKVTLEATDISVLGQQCIVYVLVPTETLLASQTYEIRLTTQAYSEPALPEGIPYPSSPGTYKIQTMTTISGVEKTQHRYIQVYGTAFTQLKVTQYNYLAAEYNLLWVEFVPTTTITTSHQIVLEFPTLSSNGTTMFDNNLGLNGYSDGDQVPVDVFDSAPLDNNYMKCRIYFGDSTRAVPARVVCGFLAANLVSPAYLRFAFGFVNPPRITVPSIPSQISLPIIVYSYDPFYFEKTNFNLVNAAVLVYNGEDILAPNGYFATLSNQLQMPNDNLIFGDAHTFPLLVGDSYVMRFNFPLRVNDKFPGLCKSTNGVAATGVYGDAYYHERLRIVVCKVTSMTVPLQIAPLSATMMLSGFYTPWYRLADSERIVHAIATYHSTSTSQVINYFDLFPHLVPRWQFTNPSSLQLEGHLKHYVACQSDDYVFTVQLESPSSTALDLQYCKMISIHLPLTTIIDYYTLNTDCVEYPGSQIHVVRCNIDLSARAIFVQIVPGIYNNGMTISVKTKDHALRNPCVFWNAFNIQQFIVYFYSWENITYADTRSPDYAYMVIDRRNVLPFTLTHVQQQYPAGLFSYYYTFDWIHTPHERTYNEFPQYTLNQYSPFSFDIWLTTAVAVAPAGQFHRISLEYGLNYVTRASQWALDLNYDKTVCYLDNNRVQRCYLDTTNKVIYMDFSFGIPAGKPIHVYFSILDPRNPHFNGFRYNGTSDIDKVRVDLTLASGANLVFQTEPFMAKETHVGGTGATLPQRGIHFATIDYATVMTGRLNVLDMTFYVNRSDITGLQFIIPLRNQINQLIYNLNSRSAFFDINDGGQYPCGNNNPGVSGTGYPKCFIYNGDNTEMGFPTVITMIDFQYSGSVIKARLLLSNPDIDMKWFTIKVRAYSGTPDSQSVFGHQYVGYWYFVNVFRTVPGTYTSVGFTNWASSSYLSPGKGNWREQTTWTFQGTSAGGLAMSAQPVGLGGYAIVQVLLNNYLSGYADDQFCETQYNIGMSSSSDMLILKSKQSQYTKAFFIKKWSAAPWSVQYFKCKHYGSGLVSYEYPTQIIMQQKLHNYNILNSYFPAVASQISITYFEVTQGRVLLQFDLTTMMTTLNGDLFIWDNQVDYQLNVDLIFYSFVTWNSVSACYVTGGFLNTKGTNPNCFMRNTYAFTVRGFQEILNRRDGSYVIKIQLDVSDISSSPNSLGANMVLYANSDTNLAREWIYSTSTSNTYSRSMSVLSQLTNGRYCGVSYSFTTTPYNTYTPNNLNVDILDFGLSSTSILNIKLKINPLGSFAVVWSGYNSYPWLRFYVEGFDYTCTGINRMDLTYIDSLGNRGTPYNARFWGGTRCGPGFFQVEFYASGVTANGNWAALTAFSSTEFIEVDAQFAITATEKPYLRDWIGIRSFINTFHYRYCCQLYDIWGWWICSQYDCYTYLQGYSQQAHSPIKLADSLTLGSLSTNVGIPTQFMFTIIQIYPQIGRNNVDKLLLLQFNTGTHPFNYINSTTGNHLIECRCITSWASTFNPSTTVTPECYLRIPVASFIRFAVTIDIDVAPNQNLQCYFPGWLAAAAFSYTATAKLINEGSSFPPWVADNRFYGGFYWITAQNSVPFTSLTAPGAITISESPSIYSTGRYVNLFHTSAYSLTLTIPSTILDPIVYVDFQKSGFIPDQSFCSSAAVFAYCRVYNTIRNIIVAQFSTAISVPSVTFTKGAVNLQYPKHKEPGTNYDILAYMRPSTLNQYTWTGNLARSDTNLLTTVVQFYCEPEKSTSSNLETFRSNLIFSFKMGGHTLFSTPKQGAKVVITDTSGLLTIQRGCTAASVDDPTFILDCEVKGSQILVTNPSYINTLSVSGLIQVVVGIRNPSVAVTWTLKTYEYWFNAANYGQQIETTVVYTPNVEAGTEQLRSQIRMLPFNTKVYSTTHTPFRIAFKISNSPPSLPDNMDYDLGYKMILKGFDALPSFTNFECLFKEYTLEPSQKVYTPLPNSYRNWKQNTQYIPLYAYCNKIGTDLEIEAPRTKPLSINNYYELVIMPTGVGLTQTGFNDALDAEFRLITYPGSCEYIGEWMYYSGHMFKLNSMYLVTYRPLVDTALQLHFELLFPSPFTYPTHYFEIHFQDINFNAIKAPYNQKGIKIPCTLSSQFVTAGRENGPRCVVNYVHQPHGDLVIRVTQIGPLPVSNSYKISLDDFLLPDLSMLLEQSNQFSVCLRYHKEDVVDVHHQRCFEEIFVIDGVLNTIPVVNNVGTFYNPPQNLYAAAVTGKLQFTYPMTSTSLDDQKSMARIKGGYSATSPSPLSFGSHSLLWYNPELNLYILKQPSVTAGTLYNITMNGLVNPEPYQKQEYSYINTVQMTYYGGYHPNNYYLYSQPPYSYFVLYSSMVSLTATYQSDIRTQIPTDSQSIVKMRILITDTVAELTRKLNDVFQVTFNGLDVQEVEECWVESVNTPVPYRSDGWCQTTTDGRVLLYNFYNSNVNANLNLWVRMRHISTNIRIVSKLYSDNGQIQYNDTYTRTNSKILTSTSNHILLSFTQNYYTPYYFQQHIVPLTISTTCKYLHLSLNLPQDMTHALTIFSVTLPATILPTNLVEVKHKCEWLLVDRYNRQFHTGVYSHCVYSAGKIVVMAPYGGLLANRAGGPYPYLLRIREMDVINTVYVMPLTAKPEEILFGFNDTNIFKYDTLIIHPYEHFTSLAPSMYTLNIDQLNTYHIEFIPSVTVAPGFEAVLELSIDNRYLVQDLGMEALFANEGIDYNNQTRIDNLNYNVKYDLLINAWRNGAPFTCYTSTGSLANQTTVHTGKGLNNKRSRITHLLETAYVAGTKYIWKVPLLLNPSTLNLPFRMNLTLWSYQATGIGIGQKQLFYEIINHKFTQPNTPSSLTYTLPYNNAVQTTNANISVKIGSIGDVPALGESIELKLNNKLTGIIDLDNLELYTEADLSYTFYFFPRVNLLIGHKKVTDFSTVVDLGAQEVTNQYADYYGYQWLKIHSLTTQRTVRKAGPSSKLLTNCLINPINIFTVLQGIGNVKDSQFLLTLTFTNTNCWIPRNSTLVISYSNALFEALRSSQCYVSWREYSCVHSSGKIEITFYEMIPISRALNLRVYLRAKAIGTATFTGYIYGIPGTLFTKVIDMPNMGSLQVLTDNTIDLPLFQPIQVKPIYQLTQVDIRGTILPYKPLNYIDITHPFTSSLASQQRMLMRKNGTSPYLFDYRTELAWLQNMQSVVSNVQAVYTVPPNGLLTYNVLPNEEHTFILESTYDVSGSFNNFTVGPVGQYYQFQYLTNNEIAYDEVYPVPVAEHLVVINPFTQISQETAIGLQFSITNLTIVPGNRITIQLDTYNLRYDMFRKTSGYSIECVQRVKGILTWQPILVCEVTQQPTPTNPNRALIVTVYPKLSVPAGTVMEIWLSPIFNPDIVMVSGVTVRVDKDCNGKKRCVFYQSRGYYRTTTGMTMTSNNVGTFVPSQTQVLLTNVDHTFNLLPDTYTAAFFRYPENYNTIMPLSCVQSGGNTCLIFPNQKRVLTILPNVSTSAITLQGMTNGIYLQPQSKFIDVLALTPTASNLYQIPHNNLTTRRIIPTTAAPTWMTITPTQTPGIFLRNYMNTVNISIYGLYSTTFVNCFYINAPKEIVTWDTKYCNATFESLNHDPYPTRLLCSFINDTTLQILIPEGVEENYLPNITQEFIMTVHAKFFIQDFAPGDGVLYVTQPVISGQFNAYGSYSVPNHSYPYYITEASNTIVISEHRVPIIGRADFNTESFAERLANVNEKTTFELLIDPVTTDTVKRIQVVIPEEFGYPPVGVHDACDLITTDTTHIANCYEIRRNNQTIVSLQLVDAYDNGPRILKIGSEDIASWFTAPPLPGSWYNMTVLMYAANGTLLEAQTTKNCSEIGGLDLSMPGIVITNGRDENKNQIVDVSFTVGNMSIRQGYPDGLSNGQFYTEIRIIFENLGAFDRALGLNRLQGERTGCVTRNMNYNREISCTLDIGLNINDQPYISVTGYEPIMPGTNVTISLANILQLPLTQRSTVSVAVMLKRVGESKTAFLYNPTKKVLMSTSAYSSVLPTQLSLVYSSPRVINSPTTLTFTITPTVDINSYFVLKFPEDGLNDEYQLFNPSCAFASRVQIFYRSDIVRIYPLSTHLAGTSRSYVITGFPSPKFALGPLPWNVTVQAYRNLKQANTQLYTIQNFEMASCRLNFGFMTGTSPYTHDTEVTYVFEFAISSTTSTSQNSITIGIKFPDSYGDIRTSDMTCSMNSNATCQFVKANYLEISGTRGSGQLVHRLTLEHVKNPSTLANIFQITSYIGQNIENIICSGQTQVTLLNSPIQNCHLDATTTHSTKTIESTYHFGLTCPDIIRNNTVMLIKLGNNYSFNNLNVLPCWADSRDNLLTETCTIKYIDGSFYLEVQNIMINKNEKTIGINVNINNPITTGLYTFSANLTVFNYTYGLTSTDNVTIYDGVPTTIQSVELVNLPKESGMDAYYFLRIPTSAVNNSLDFGFPPEFELPPNVYIQKFTSNSSSWASSLKYSDILNLNGVPLSSEVISTDSLTQKISIDSTNTPTNSTGSWTYFMIKSIRNPAYQSQQNFTLDSYFSFDNQQQLLTATTTTPLNYTLNPPAGDILHTNISVVDNDVLYFTNYTLTYRLSAPLQTNSTTFYIRPPLPDMNYGLLALNCCLVVNSSAAMPYTYCAVCQIVGENFRFVIAQNGIKIPADTDFKILLVKLYNPPNATDCTVFAHHELSYFALKVLKNEMTVTHSAMPPTNMMSPCQKYRVIRADIIPIFPDTLYAGMVHSFTIKLSQPTKMLRVTLNCSDPMVTFLPNILYFPNYDVTQLSGSVIVSSIANNNNKAYINITHEESGTFDFYRPNLPYPVAIVADHKEYVIVQEKKAESIGYDIVVPIDITLPSSVDMYLEIVANPQDPNLIFNSTQILLPAFSKSGSFSFRYNGKKIPPTINLTLTLKSPYPLSHQLQPATVYLYFSTSPEHNTLPPVMSVQVMHAYRNNTDFVGRTVYHYSNTGYILYDQLLPYIVSHRDEFVGSTSANLVVHTREEATIAYLVYQYGDHLTNYPKSPQEIRSHANSIHVDSTKNSTFIVNPYATLNLTMLQQQTQYFIYMMAYSTLGNSLLVTTHTLTTRVLSNAASFKLITRNYVQTDQVKIVRALADILKIDPYRIKIVSSERNVALNYTNTTSYENQPYYEHMVTISPSTTKDDLPAKELILERLMTSQFGKMRLQELIPNWIGRFNLSDLRLENRVKPAIRSTPAAKKITYYNATFEVRYWQQARIHAILLQYLNQTQQTLNYTQNTIQGTLISPTADPIITKQITLGLDWYNHKASQHYTALCNKQGYASIFFDELNPGSKYVMYVTATSPEIYEPTIYSDSIAKTEFYTLWNPNLRNKEKLVLKELKELKPAMYEAIKEFYDNEDKKKNRAKAIK